MKLKLFCLFLLFFNYSLLAQTLEDVTLVTTGSASTEEEAVLVALRGAIEQTFGTFVSANTTLLDDDLVKDEIVSISKGNIKKYEKIATTVLSNGQVMVTVKSDISISNLITYAQNKGSKAEFAGATFGQNVKLMKLKSNNTRIVYENLCTQVIALLDNAFDFKIELQEPIGVKLYYVTSGRGGYTNYGTYLCDGYQLDAVVSVMANEVNDAIYRLVNGTLKAISLTESEYNDFLKLGIDCCALAGKAGGYWGLSDRSFLQLDDQMFRVYLPISNKDVIALDRPVIEKITRGFFNYVILDFANDMDYTWRLRQGADKILGYNNPRFDTYKIYNNINIINNGLGLFNSKGIAFNGYYINRDNDLFFDVENVPLIEGHLTIVGFGGNSSVYEKSYIWEKWESLSFIDLNNLYIGDYSGYSRNIWHSITERRESIRRSLALRNQGNHLWFWFTGKEDSKLVLPEEIAYALDKELSEKDRMVIARTIIPKKELKEYSKNKQVVDGKIIASYIPAVKEPNTVLLSYRLSFFFTEEEISRFTGLEIVPHKYL